MNYRNNIIFKYHLLTKQTYINLLYDDIFLPTIKNTSMQLIY
jgi:hypothetical protein